MLGDELHTISNMFSARLTFTRTKSAWTQKVGFKFFDGRVIKFDFDSAWRRQANVRLHKVKLLGWRVVAGQVGSSNLTEISNKDGPEDEKKWYCTAGVVYSSSIAKKKWCRWD